MNPLTANFDELYRRHLCRHSAWGINVMHLMAVVGIYFALCGIGFALPAGEWIVGTVVLAYLAVIGTSLPLKNWLVSAIAMAIIAAAAWSLSVIPWWAHVISIFAWHRFQNWNHKLYHEERDMSEFAEKYQKGFALFFLLAIYELPILSNFLLFEGASGTPTQAEA